MAVSDGMAVVIEREPLVNDGSVHDGEPPLEQSPRAEALGALDGLLEIGRIDASCGPSRDCVALSRA